MLNHEFKSCGLCSRWWPTRDEFLSDPTIYVVGYQADVQAIERGLLLFRHKSASCGTIIAIPISEFLDLYTGPRYPENRALTPGCPRYCLDKDQLARCDVLCECAAARETISVLADCLNSARSVASFMGAAAGQTAPNERSSRAPIPALTDFH